jgi:hypothetical protein
MLIKLTAGAVVAAASVLGAGAAVATPALGPDASQTTQGGIQFIARFDINKPYESVEFRDRTSCEDARAKETRGPKEDQCTFHGGSSSKPWSYSYNK